MTWEYLDLGDFLLIAESALHAPAATFGGVEFYPDLAGETAVLAAPGPAPPTTPKVMTPSPPSKASPPGRSTKTP